MKVTYTPNPLETRVELDAQEKELLRLKIKLAEYEDMIFGAHFDLTSRLEDMGSLKALTLEEAVKKVTKELDPDYWCDDEEGKKDHSKLDSRVDALLDHYLAELQGAHHGDCTAVPVTCSKCLAEDLLGINTLGTYPGKGILHELQRTFTYLQDGEVRTRTAQEVLQLVSDRTRVYLEDYLKTHGL